MGRKIKIYCVLFDALPLDKGVVSFAKKNDMELLSQVGGCFTNNSCIEMLTSKMPSDLRDHGMGHLCHNKYRDSLTKDIQWPWKNQILLNILLSKGWNVRYHNGEHFSSVISNSKKIKKTASEKDDNSLLGEISKATKLMKKEKKFTDKMQKEKHSRNTFYFIRHEHYHKAIDTYKKKNPKKTIRKKKIAIKRSLEIMKHWDTNEPNSVFWFFSDHGDWNYPFDMRHPNPQNYLSFALCKDNTKKPLKIKSKFISIRDFFPTIMDKFGYKYDKSNETYSVEKEQDEDRVLYIEDGRKKINEDISTTAQACKFVNWKNGIPKGILQVSYHTCNKTWVCRLVEIDDLCLTKNIIDKDVIDKELKKAVLNKFKWSVNYR